MPGGKGGDPRVERRRVVRREHRALHVEERHRGTEHPGGSLTGSDDEVWTLFGANL